MKKSEFIEEINKYSIDNHVGLIRFIHSNRTEKTRMTIGLKDCHDFVWRYINNSKFAELAWRFTRGLTIKI